jgi:hypothetical protein
MSEYKIVKPEKGVIGIMKGDEHIGYVENTSASYEVLSVIIEQQEKLKEVKLFLEGYGMNGNTNQFDTKAARRLASKL